MLRNGVGRWRQAVVATLLAVLIGVAGWQDMAQARESLSSPLSFAPAEQTHVISATELPPQGRSMLALIHQGGPFAHEKDGVVFRNRERLLPANVRNYYREYTVRTPKERSRGARRIVCGGVQPAAPDACFYTDDHYASFRKIVH